MIRSLLFTITLLAFTFSSKAQNKDTILLMNGNTVVEKVKASSVIVKRRLRIITIII